MVETTINLDQYGPEPPGPEPHSGCASCGTGKALAGLIRCGNGLEKIYPTTAVRFGFMRYIGEFTHSPELKFTCGAKVVMQTQRGLEIGDQVSLTCGGCDKSVTRDQMRDWVATSGEDTYMFDAGRILREATAGDLAEFARMQDSAREKRKVAQKIANRLKLSLRIAECECLFGGERILFYFTSAERVDFRAMVKELATEYQTRIEMRQVGARDEARLLADFETCGREVCCKVFLKTLRPISMRMAKLQKATLDPTQVSGRCGRLKCCLRYEHIGYEEMDKKLPRIGVRIRTEHGIGIIVNRQVLTQIVQIRTDDDTVVAVVAEDILERNVKAAPPEPAKPASPPRSRRPERGGARGKPSSPPPPQARPRQAPAKDTEPAPATDKAPAEGADKASPDDAQSVQRRRRRRRRRRRGSKESGDGGTPGPPPGKD